MLPDESSRATNTTSSAGTPPPRIVQAAPLLLPLLGCLLLLANGGLAPLGLGKAQAKQAEMPNSGTQRIPDFPLRGPTPAGQVRPDAVAFQPITSITPLQPLGPLTVHVLEGDLTLKTVNSPRVLWHGPITEARFVLTTVKAMHTLKDGTGQIIWSDADENTALDLLLQKESDGTARLLDKQRMTLWTGILPTKSPPTHSTSVTRNGASSYQMDTAGVHIEGNGDTCTVTRSDPAQILWAGKLPSRPTILVRDGSHFAYLSPHRSASGMDSTGDTRFALETGQVTMTDLEGQVLGMRPIEVVKVTSERRYEGKPQPSQSVRLLTQEARLTSDGTVFLTYRDAAGRIFRRAKAYRGKSHQGYVAAG